MIDIVSVENMRKSDAYTIKKYIPSKKLMYEAGLGVFRSVDWKEPVAIVCGSGNNAGDGYVIAKLLHDDGKDVTIILVSDKFSEDGRYYFDICREAGIRFVKFDDLTNYGSGTVLAEYNCIVDCLLGTGFKGQIRQPVRAAIEAVNSSGAYVISVDINSGLNGDSGMAGEIEQGLTADETGKDKSAEDRTAKIKIEEDKAVAGKTAQVGVNPTYLCVKSDLTVSIGSYKSGLFLNMAKDVIGRRENCDIGIELIDRPFGLLEPEDLKAVFKDRPNYSNKGSYGYIALIGGSEKYSGAIRLAYLANAAMRAGAGVVKVAAPRSICQTIASHILESTIYPLSDTSGEIIFNKKEIDGLIKNVKSIAFGMGIGTGQGAAQTLEYLLNNYRGNLIIDADGLTLLSKMDPELIRSSSADIILTPHIKEFSRLTGLTIDTILQSPIETAQAYARDKSLILLLKGPTTIVTDGETTYLTDRGCAGMATAGSGDVLSGILAAVCAYGGMVKEDNRESGGNELLLAVAAGAYINGLAGEIAQAKTNSISMIASDTVSCIAEAVSQVLN